MHQNIRGAQARWQGYKTFLIPHSQLGKIS
jgi:hypothetical protein